jgi:hypothetical protein
MGCKSSDKIAGRRRLGWLRNHQDYCAINVVPSWHRNTEQIATADAIARSQIAFAQVVSMLIVFSMGA